MIQTALPVEIARKPALSLADKLARYFKARPNQWIDGRELSTVAGAYAWRTRCSDLRREPYNMRIENRKRRLTFTSYTKISEYRYVPAKEAVHEEG